MDFQNLLRGFFGLPSQRETDFRLPPDVPPYYNAPKDDVDEPTETTDFPRLPRDKRRPGFLFGEVFNVLEEMFKDMEQSMRDMDQVFSDYGMGFDEQDELLSSSHFPSELGTEKDSDLEDLPSLPIDQNIRGLVLKDDDKPCRNAEKLDKDLDELYSSCKINISELPLLSKNKSDSDTMIDRVTPKRGQSSYERVYSTYSFNNGKWEGKTVREDEAGKEMTSFVRNENGEIDQTTEFFPNQPKCSPELSNDRNTKNPLLEHPKSLFDRLFKTMFN